MKNNKLSNEEPWVKVDEVMNTFDCCRSMAYKLIRQLNSELEEQGFLTYSGKVSRKYFNQRYFA